MMVAMGVIVMRDGGYGGGVITMLMLVLITLWMPVMLCWGRFLLLRLPLLVY